MNFVYAYVGALDRVLDNPERDLELGDMSISLDALWQPESVPLRKTERFKAFTRKAGLVIMSTRLAGISPPMAPTTRMRLEARTFANCPLPE